jgi:hypothetical protein
MWKIGALAGVALLGLAHAAHAVPVSFNLTHTPAGSPGLLMSSSVPEHTFSFDITQPGAGDGGYNPLTDALSSATIAFVFTDDATDPGGQAEHVWVSVDAAMLVSNQTATTTYSFSSGSVATLLSSLLDGVLNIVITRQAGDFLFVSSSLAVSGDRSLTQDPTPTPEPVSLGLIGLGLLGTTMVRRRRRSL